MMKRLLIFILSAALLLPCCGKTSDPPQVPTLTSEQEQNHTVNTVERLSCNTLGVNRHATWQGQDCESLVLSVWTMTRSGEQVTGLCFSAEQGTLLGGVALGRSLALQTVDGKTELYLTFDAQEQQLFARLETCYVQLYFAPGTLGTEKAEITEEMTACAMEITTIYEAHRQTEAGTLRFYDRDEPVDLYGSGEALCRATDLAPLPELTALPEGFGFTGQIRYSPNSGAVSVQYGPAAILYANPSDGTLEKSMNYEMNHGFFSNVKVYEHKGVRYYIVESWPSCGGVTEPHDYNIKWEHGGREYNFWTSFGIQSSQQAIDIIHGIEHPN